MKGWQFQASGGPMEKNLSMPTTGIPTPSIKDSEILVRNLATTMNAIDYKISELGFITRLVFRNPITPGLEVCGTVVRVGSKVAKYKVDDMVYGSLPPATTHGGLAQFVPIAQDLVAKVPEGLKPDDMVSMGMVAMTSYAALQPYIKAGDKVFINGGSGGTGVMAIQIAKALGAHVTTSTSGANIDLVESLGADTVLNYKKADIIAQIKDTGQLVPGIHRISPSRGKVHPSRAGHQLCGHPTGHRKQDNQCTRMGQEGMDLRRTASRNDNNIYTACGVDEGRQDSGCD
jgi:NADPH:quinone reductase-like Zn-dependent oxidoreductase